MRSSSNTYVQLSISDREEIFGLLKQGKSIRYIASRLGRSHTTVARELKRNCKYGRAYKPSRAQSRAERVASRQRHHGPLKNPLVYVYVREKLRLGWSPETIAGRLPRDHPSDSIHHETIYKYIYSTKKRRERFVKYLTHSHIKRRQKSGRSVRSVNTPRLSQTTRAISITTRPIFINSRNSLGHWETDLMEGPRASSQALSVTVERKSRYVSLAIVRNKSASEKTSIMGKVIHSLPLQLKRSMTVDNGTENSGCDNWGITTYVCNPYHSWEKGTVENTIGRIRYFIPKATPLELFTDLQIQSLQEKMNNTPRKCLDYLTPKEYLLKSLQVKQPKRLKWCTSYAN